MAKKDKKAEGAVQNREIFQRMNFLYQAAMYMATLTVPQQSDSSSDSQPANKKDDITDNAPDCQQRVSEGESIDSSAVRANENDKDMDQDMSASIKNLSGTTPTFMDTNMRSLKKTSRKKKRELLRQRKARIAMEQISHDESHQGLKFPYRNRTLHPLSGTGRFYASTLREIGRKNVIRM
jgi:hypothetical protein